MQEYRAFLLDLGGRITLRHEFEAVDDEAAKEHARQYVDGHDVEVWQRERRIALLQHDK